MSGEDVWLTRVTDLLVVCACMSTESDVDAEETQAEIGFGVERKIERRKVALFGRHLR